MNLAQFFEHWRIVENPFRGEEARHDSVFARIGLPEARMPFQPAASPSTQRPGGEPDGSAPGVDGIGVSGPESTPSSAGSSIATLHSDFEKILGEPGRPSTAIVFGEKGSGKTAIRLQIAARIAAHNREHPDRRVLLVPYDDLNAILDRFSRRAGGKSPAETFSRFRLADHLDAILSTVVPHVVDAILRKGRGEGEAAATLDFGVDARKRARGLDLGTRRDLLLLQIAYDRAEGADSRTSQLRRVLRIPLPASVVLWNLLAFLGWAPAIGLLMLAWGRTTLDLSSPLLYVIFVLLGLWLGVLLKRFGWDAVVLRSIAVRMRRQLRVQSRPDASYARSLAQLDPELRDAAHLPITESDEPRYAMLGRLRAILRVFGYTGITVVIDRVDEPTLISGDPDRMRAFIWPLLNNKFLQQEGLGIKMLLPIELRHALFKESSAFFQEARLDKQNMIERLTWTGATLYDLCDARLRACRDPAAAPIALLDLFAEDVTARDLIDALDQMHQPRDAFKFLYACMVEHCSNVTAEQAQWRIPRLIVESVRKQQSDRVQQLYRGIRPA